MFAIRESRIWRRGAGVRRLLLRCERQAPHNAWPTGTRGRNKVSSAVAQPHARCTRVWTFVHVSVYTLRTRSATAHLGAAASEKCRWAGAWWSASSRAAAAWHQGRTCETLAWRGGGAVHSQVTVPPQQLLHTHAVPAQAVTRRVSLPARAHTARDVQCGNAMQRILGIENVN